MKALNLFLMNLVLVGIAVADKTPKDGIHFSEVVMSEIIPAIDGDNAGFAALKKARASLDTKCTEWKKSQKDLAGDSYLYAECGNEVLDLPIYSAGYEERTFGKGDKPVGWISRSSALVVFEGSQKRLKPLSVPPVTSEVKLYRLLEPTSFKLDALKNGIKEYQERCDSWRKTIKGEMGDNFVYASCDGIRQGDRGNSGIRIVDTAATRSLRVTARPSLSKVYYLVDLEEE